MTSKIKTFQDLVVWQKAHKLVIVIYEATKQFPKEELFALVNQMRRAAVSITSNIAEGFGRQSYSEKANFYGIAQGSATELQSQVLVARDVGYISSSDSQNLNEQIIEIHKLLSVLIRKSRDIHNS